MAEPAATNAPNAPTANTTLAPATERVLGVEFFTGPLTAACERISAGGLLTAPSGPGLACDLVQSPAYRDALLASDVVLTDSAFMVLLWRLRRGRRLPRHSGLTFLRCWMDRPVMRRPGAVVWVMPTAAEAAHTLHWLGQHGYSATTADFYVAPTYGTGPLADAALAALIEARRPAVIYLGIGGGVQERVGHFLRAHLSYRPTILCLGAALAFMTGAQVRIAPWADRSGLGWLWRIFSDPSRYLLRYLRATRLAWLVFRYGSESPPLSGDANSPRAS